MGDSSTELGIAVKNGDIDSVQDLINRGVVDVNNSIHRTERGATPLFIAAENGHTDVVKALLAAGAGVNTARTDDGATPLFIAAQNGHIAIVNALLKKNADVSMQQDIRAAIHEIILDSPEETDQCPVQSLPMMQASQTLTQVPRPSAGNHNL